MSDRAAIMQAMEAILFVSDEPLAPALLAQAVDADRKTIEDLLQQLATRYEESGAGIVLRNVAGGWRLSTNPDAAGYVEKFVLSSRHTRLTKASLETLAIIAYKQPVTRHQIAAIRGVNSDGVLQSLMDRGLVAEAGREEVPGRPILYETTPEFLERLGLASVSDLPSLAPLLTAAAENRDEGDSEEDGGREAELA